MSLGSQSAKPKKGDTTKTTTRLRICTVLVCAERYVDIGVETDIQAEAYSPWLSLRLSLQPQDEAKAKAKAKAKAQAKSQAEAKAEAKKAKA